MSHQRSHGFDRMESWSNFDNKFEMNFGEDENIYAVADEDRMMRITNEMNQFEDTVIDTENYPIATTQTTGTVRMLRQKSSSSASITRYLNLNSDQKKSLIEVW